MNYTIKGEINFVLSLIYGNMFDIINNGLYHWS